MSFSESHAVTAVDGVRLHIRIKGELRDRPPLLYLHGGPGGGLNLAAFESDRDLAGFTGYTISADHCLAVQTQIAASLWPELYTLDLTASLEKLSTPLLMVACGMDGAVPLTSVESAFSAYGRSCHGVTKQWLLLESGNHLPFTEPANRQRCMDGVLDFLEKQKGEPANEAGPLLKSD